MTNSKIVILSLCAAAILSQSISASADPMTLQQIRDLEMSVATKISVRAEALAKEQNIRTLDLRARSLERHLGEADMKLRTVGAMATQRGDVYTISKEFIFTNADLLLYGCFLGRALKASSDVDVKKAERETPVAPELDARYATGICSLSEVSLLILASTGLVIPSKTGRTIVAEAFSRAKTTTEISGDTIIKRTEALKYPKSSLAVRAGLIALGGLMLVQQTLAWTYNDEINYRRSIADLSSSGVNAEIQNQIKQANDLNLELASVRAAKILLANPQQN